MDAELRKLSTRALSGDVHDQARALAARVRSEVSGLRAECQECEPRSGDKNLWRACPREECKFCNGTGRVTISWEDRLALAAYCGDGAALELARPRDPDWTSDRLRGLAGWLEGLWRWPPEVLLRAALAAGEAVLKTVYLDDPRIETCSDPDCGSVICLAERALAACRAYVEDPTEERREAWVRAMADMPLWVPEPHPTAFGPGGPGMCTRSGAILAAARETSEETIRAAASEALAGWALQ